MRRLATLVYSTMTDKAKGKRACLIGMGLNLLSRLYSFSIFVILLGYKKGILRQERLGCPVISIGNVTVGGTGKTPLVIAVAEAVRSKGARSVVLTRGYRQTDGFSDEAALLRRHLPGVPVLVGADRAGQARDFLRDRCADVFILDDGFQHWRLFREEDWVLIDATNPFGNGAVLPRGILREPLKGLRRATLIILTKTDQVSVEQKEALRRTIERMCPKTHVIETVHRPVAWVDMATDQTKPIESLRGHKAVSCCGIGRPDSFAKTLLDLGVEVERSFVFGDHHGYTRQDCQALKAACAAHGVTNLVTTEKDAVKLRRFAPLLTNETRVMVVKIQIDIIKGKHVFLERIDRLLRR